MIQPLRANVFIELGDMTRLSKIIEEPDGFKAVNRRGTLRAVGPRCQILKANDIGSDVVVNVIKGQGRIIPPRMAPEYGLPAKWHVIAHESTAILQVSK